MFLHKSRQTKFGGVKLSIFSDFIISFIICVLRAQKNCHGDRSFQYPQHINVLVEK